MSENAPSTTPVPYELHDEQPLMPLEPIDQAIERLANNLEIVPVVTDPDPEGIPLIRYVANKFRDKYTWVRYFGPNVPEDANLIDPAQSPADKAEFDLAVQNLRADRLTLKNLAKLEGRWWIYSSSEQFIDQNTREGIRIQEGENSLDVLNCTESDLSDKERASIEKVFSRVANYTGGKIFERVAGVVLLTADQFPEGIAGDFQPSTGVLRVNMDSLHESEGIGRYSPYFKDNQADWFEIILAHELGHSMDIATIDEADAHGIDKDSYWWNGFGGVTKDFSGFDDKFGWEHKIEEIGDPEKSLLGSKTTVHRINEAMVVECRESAPTGYAMTNPREDFAETFAIASMGGDMSKLRARHQVLSETVRIAEGNATVGPKLVTSEPITDGSQIFRPINRVGLRTYIIESAAKAS